MYHNMKNYDRITTATFESSDVIFLFKTQETSYCYSIGHFANSRS